jgi:uncharacterized protein with GYD domain
MKFLIRGKYDVDGAKGLIKEGGSARKATVTKIVEGMGGKVESFYYAYGEHDVFVICDMPDVSSGLALSLAVNASGRVHISTMPLITAEEIDAATKKTVNYRAPGA